MKFQNSHQVTRYSRSDLEENEGYEYFQSCGIVSAALYKSHFQHIFPPISAKFSGVYSWVVWRSAYQARSRVKNFTGVFPISRSYGCNFFKNRKKPSEFQRFWSKTRNPTGATGATGAPFYVPGSLES